MSSSRRLSPAKLYLFIALFSVFVVGIYLTYNITKYGEQQMQHSFESQSTILSAALSPEEVMGLKPVADAAYTSAYRDISARLRAVEQTTASVHFAYIMKKINGKIVFVCDAEEMGSKDYTPPGEVYNEASPALIRMFETGEPLLEGPLQDKYGTFVSALSPIKDVDGKVVAVVGLDVDATHWQKMVNIYKYSGLMICGLMLGLVAVTAFLSKLFKNWKNAQKQVFMFETTDQLTGLPNFAYAKESLSYEISAKGTSPLALMMIEIDGFKRVYDQHGFDAGRQIYKLFADSLRPQISDKDVLTVAGEFEFLAVVRDIHSMTEVTDIAFKMIDAVKAVSVAQGLMHYNINCYVGISIYPMQGKKLDALLANASSALLESHGKADHVQIYSAA